MEIRKPKDPNWQLEIGQEPEGLKTCLRLHWDNPPNRFQRWAMGKFLGLHWSRL